MSDLDPNNEWLGTAYVCKLMRASEAKVRRVAKQQGIKTYKDAQGDLRFNPDDVDAYLLERDQGSAASSELASTLKSVVESAKHAQAHAATFASLFIVPSQNVADALRKDLEAARCRIVYLETRMDEAVTAREALLNQQLERDLIAQEAKSKLDRKERIVRIAENKLPQVIDRFLGGGAKAAAAVKLLESLDPALLDALLASGLLSAEQAALVKELAPESPVTHHEAAE